MANEAKYHPELNILKLINKFWEIDMEAGFSHLEVHLFFKLIEINNRLKWKPTFRFANSRLESEIGTRAKNLIAARQRLLDFKVVNYEKGTTRNAGTYSFLNVLYPTKESNQESNSGSNQGNNEKVIRGSLDKLNENETKPIEETCETHSSLGIPKIKKFKKPSLDEIQNHYCEKCSEKNISPKPNFSEKFFNFYESKDWMIGKNKMKNWKSAVSTWITKTEEDEYSKSTKRNGFNTATSIQTVKDFADRVEKMG